MSSWVKTGEDTGNRVPFAEFKCKVCGRRAVTCGSEPQSPCVCSPAPRPLKRATPPRRPR